MSKAGGSDRTPLLTLAALIVLLCTPAAHAQEGEGDDASGDGLSIQSQETQSQETQSGETRDRESANGLDTPQPSAEMSIRYLELQLKPLRRDALIAVAEAWMALLAAKTRQVTELERQALEAAGDEKAALQEQAARVSRDKNAVAERAAIVIEALEAKGGDVEEFSRYVHAVSATEVDVTDAQGVWIYVRNWITSPDGGIRVGLNILKAIVVLIMFWIAAGIIGGLARRGVNRFQGASELLKNFLAKMTRRLVVLVGIVVAISMFGVNITPLVAAIGAAGLVVGLALQGTLSNFASGILILLYRPFDVGDYIDAGGVSGTVGSMSLVTTTITTPDNKVLIVPNNAIWNDVITNVTGSATRRVDMTFGIGYPEDIDKAKEVLLEVLRAHPLTLDDPEPVVQVSALADSSVNFIARPWVKTSDYWAVFWEITAEVKRRFDTEGIGIPFPQMDVHIHRPRDDGSSDD